MALPSDGNLWFREKNPEGLVVLPMPSLKREYCDRSQEIKAVYSSPKFARLTALVWQHVRHGFPLLGGKDAQKGDDKV